VVGSHRTTFGWHESGHHYGRGIVDIPPGLAGQEDTGPKPNTEPGRLDHHICPFALGFTFGVPIIRAVTTYPDWPDWALPLPPGIGLGLVLITGAAFC